MALVFEDVLGAEVGVGEHEVLRRLRPAGVQHTQQVRGPVEVAQPGIGFGGSHGCVVADLASIDPVQLAEEPAQARCRVWGRVPAE